MPIWLSDYWREQEEKRKREADANNGTKPLLGHEDIGNSGAGFDRDKFDLGMIKGQIQTRGKR